MFRERKLAVIVGGENTFVCCLSARSFEAWSGSTWHMEFLMISISLKARLLGITRVILHSARYFNQLMGNSCRLWVCKGIISKSFWFAAFMNKQEKEFHAQLSEKGWKSKFKSSAMGTIFIIRRARIRYTENLCRRVLQNRKTVKVTQHPTTVFFLGETKCNLSSINTENPVRRLKQAATKIKALLWHISRGIQLQANA